MPDRKLIAETVEAVAEQAGCRGLMLAYSGGRDSTVLLDLLAGATSRRLRAVFIEHGLQGEQPAWREKVSEQCRRRDVPLQCHALHLKPVRGDSVEALAREVRYKALAAAADGDLILLAQHQDDQAETLLLQLLRGAGPAGLAAMPRVFHPHGAVAMRPLLDCPASEIDAYAEDEGLSWFDDPSNADLRFSRNYLRHEVMPSLRRHWPAASVTLARAADWQAESQRLMAQLGVADWRQLVIGGGGLSVEKLLQLPAERQRNVLREVCRQMGWQLPPATRLNAIRALAAQASGRGQVDWAGNSVRRYRDTLYWLHEAETRAPDEFAAPLAPGTWLSLPSGLGRLRLRGVDRGVWRCALRVGGERLRPQADGGSLPLARWFQQHGVPPWQRQRTPLIFADDEIAAVGDHLLPRFRRLWPTLTVDWQRDSG